jgi:hypothetical protein
MTKTFFTLLILFAAFSGFCQSMPPVEGVPLNTSTDFHAAENVVLQVSGNLLSTPIDQANEARLKANVFLVRWMYGTPDFDFTIGQNAMKKYIEKDVDLMAVYFACLASFAIKYPSVKDQATVTLNAVKTFVGYINNTTNHVIITSKLKKLQEADQKGELKSFLKL